MANNSIWPIDKTLSGATILGPSGPGPDGKKEVLCIPQSPSITWGLPSDCLVSYPGHSLVERKDAVGGFSSSSRLSQIDLFANYLM